MHLQLELIDAIGPQRRGQVGTRWAGLGNFTDEAIQPFATALGGAFQDFPDVRAELQRIASRAVLDRGDRLPSARPPGRQSWRDPKVPPAVAGCA